MDVVEQIILFSSRLIYHKLLLPIFIAGLLVGCRLGEDPYPAITPQITQSPTDTVNLLPDLIIHSVSVVYKSSGDCPAPDQDYDTSIRIQNIGNAPAGPFVVRVNLDEKLVNSRIEPGERLEISFPGYSANFSAMVDASSLVIEKDETNNQIVESLLLPTIPPRCLATETPEITQQEAVAVLEGHTAKIWDVHFSPDGKTLISGSVDNTLRLWNSDPPRLVRTMEGHPFPVLMLEYSPNGSTLYTGSMDGILRVWDVSTGRLIQTLEGHVGWITGIDISPDGKWLATAAEDSTVRLWRLPAASIIQIIDEGMAGVSSVAFTPDSRALGWGEIDGTLRLRSISGDWIYTIKSSQQPLTSLAFSPDGDLLVTGYADGSLRVWNARDGSPIQTIYGHTHAITDLALSIDGQWLVSGSSDHSLRLWKQDEDRFSTVPLRIYTGHTGAVTGVAISPRLPLIASSSEDGTIRLWAIP